MHVMFASAALGLGVSKMDGRDSPQEKLPAVGFVRGTPVADTPVSPCRMDIHMPEMDGLEASRQIRQRYAPEDRPRIVALSADTLQVRAPCLRCWLPA